ncbi:LacI family DNA-binding transcriptional regulator [Marinivivus vitaminiproducens]|uniref:LacI family DNA-binding transcriptional regulator n=1 Tax=Marinivivus vitaminiproducens TaxID=3035935 RepID=UPI0027A2DBCA|nr:LacI family DNA-binding transcriptional regulator [Geminicoccaceae bacterium SCSIO 64248]
MSRITLQAVADTLGLSKFAVSRALAGKPGVSEETRRNVVQAARELGYLARGSAPAAARQVELIFHDRDLANSELWMNVQRGAQDEAVRQGFLTVNRWIQDARALGGFEGSAGVILLGPHEKEVVDALARSNMPLVWIGGTLQPLDQIDRVGGADREAGTYVGEALLAKGHRKLVYAHGQGGLSGRLTRLAGFREAIEAVEGASLRDIAFAELTGTGFREAFLAMIATDYEPTAIFCGNDGVAVTVVSELLRLGLAVPDDISVVGFADYACATQISPKLTTVRMPSVQMGAAAVRMLAERLGTTTLDEAPRSRRLFITPAFVERESLATATATSYRARIAHHVAGDGRSGGAVRRKRLKT